MTVNNLTDRPEFVSYVVQASDRTFLCSTQESNTEVLVFSIDSPYGIDHYETKEKAEKFIQSLQEGHETIDFYGQENIPQPFKVKTVRLIVEDETD